MDMMDHSKQPLVLLSTLCKSLVGRDVVFELLDDSVVIGLIEAVNDEVARIQILSVKVVHVDGLITTDEVYSLSMTSIRHVHIPKTIDAVDSILKQQRDDISREEQARKRFGGMACHKSVRSRELFKNRLLDAKLNTGVSEGFSNEEVLVKPMFTAEQPIEVRQHTVDAVEENNTLLRDSDVEPLRCSTLSECVPSSATNSDSSLSVQPLRRSPRKTKQSCTSDGASHRTDKSGREDKILLKASLNMPVSKRCSDLHNHNEKPLLLLTKTTGNNDQQLRSRSRKSHRKLIETEATTDQNEATAPQQSGSSDRKLRSRSDRSDAGELKSVKSPVKKRNKSPLATVRSRTDRSLSCGQSKSPSKPSSVTQTGRKEKPIPKLSDSGKAGQAANLKPLVSPLARIRLRSTEHRRGEPMDRSRASSSRHTPRRLGRTLKDLRRRRVEHLRRPAIAKQIAQDEQRAKRTTVRERRHREAEQETTESKHRREHAVKSSTDSRRRLRSNASKAERTQSDSRDRYNMPDQRKSCDTSTSTGKEKDDKSMDRLRVDYDEPTSSTRVKKKNSCIYSGADITSNQAVNAQVFVTLPDTLCHRISGTVVFAEDDVEEGEISDSDEDSAEEAVGKKNVASAWSSLLVTGADAVEIIPDKLYESYSHPPSSSSRSPRLSRESRSHRRN